MPITVGAIVARRHSCEIDVDGDVVRITFRPYTIEENERMHESAREDGTGGDVAATKFLASILEDWDLSYGANEQNVEPTTRYPTDYDHLKVLPGEFIAAVLEGIGKAQQPGKQ